ncbi:MAG: hypothetical protein ACOC83_05685 [Gemmatimonadota bacterium]
MNLARELTGLDEGVIRSPWRDHETVRGFAVMSLPFASGHILACRVIPESDFGPYSTLWVRRPDGRWSLHVDGPRLDVACPRYWGEAAAESAFADIELDWTGPNTARMRVDEPSLEWTFRMGRGPLMAAVNAINASLPLASWRSPALLRAREWLAREVLDVGAVDLSGRLPGGMHGTLMPKRIYRIEEARARLEGADLGAPVRLDEPPRFGAFRLPSCPLFAVGEAHVRVPDREEYARLRRAVSTNGG